MCTAHLNSARERSAEQGRGEEVVEGAVAFRFESCLLGGFCIVARRPGLRQSKEKVRARWEREKQALKKTTGTFWIKMAVRE
jgi:hypothetical protein